MFEEPMLKASKSFYERERDHRLNLQNIPQYIDYVKLRRDEEQVIRPSAYLSAHPETVTRLIEDVVKKVLIEDCSKDIVDMKTTGLSHLLTNAATLSSSSPSIVRDLYDLFEWSGSESAMESLRKGLVNHVLSFGRDAGSGNISGIAFIDSLCKFYHDLEAIVTRDFKGNFLVDLEKVLFA